jgi:hypothetical protein
LNPKEVAKQILDENEFGKPWKWGDTAAGLLVPILRTATTLPRDYLLMEEVKDKVKIEDSGSIGIAKITNASGKTIFIRGGAVFEGQGTQSRATQTGSIIDPIKTSQEVKINCIHASHGIQANAMFSMQGYTPRTVSQSLRKGNQHEVWASVQCYASSVRHSASEPLLGAMRERNVGSDNLAGTMKVVNKFKGSVDDAIRRMPQADNQVGVVIMDIKGIVGLEVFDSPESWKALSENVIKQYSEVFEAKAPDYLSIDQDKVVVNIQAFLELLNTATEEHPTPETTVVHVSTRQPNGSLSGEYTILHGKLIHATFAREESNYTSDTQRTRSPFSMTSLSRGTEECYGATMFGSTRRTNFEDIGAQSFMSRHQNGHKLLSNLNKPKTWTDLKPLFKHESTQTFLLKDAIANGLVTKQDKKYILTAKGINQIEGSE